MTGTSVRDDGWGTATHYSGGQPLDPRTFTEADPIAASGIAPWQLVDPQGGAEADARDAQDARDARDGVLTTDDEPRWSTPIYSGRARRRHAARVPAPNGGAAGPVADTPADYRPSHSVDAAGTAVAPPEDAPQDAPQDAGDRAAGGTGGSAVGTAAEADADDRAVLRHSRAMAVASLASRVTGFARSIMLVAALGSTGGVADAYNSGNNLPNMIYELLLGGVLSSVLIPVLVKAEAEDDDRGVAYTQRLLSLAVAALAVMTLVVVALAPWIAAVFVEPGPKRDLTAVFGTLLLPEIFFYGLGAIIMAVLNIRHVYGPGAWSPLLNNLVVMATVVVYWALPGPATLDPRTITTPQVLVLGIGTTLGIAAQALVLVPYLRRSGFAWQWRFRARTGEKDRLREIGSLGGWVLGYVVISQIGVSVIQRVGIANGGFTVFTAADLLFQMPYGVLVVSLLTAIMPRLSRNAVRADTAAVVADLSLGARLSAVALVPVTAGLSVLGSVLGVTLFAHGQSSVAGARLIGSSLAWSAFGLFPFALVMLQLRVFYAMHDGRTPTVINAFMVATKIGLVLASNAVFAAPAGTNVEKHPSVHAVQWLNISTSASYVVGAVAGYVLLARRLGRLGFARVFRTVLQVAVASAAGAAAAWGVVRYAEHLVGPGRAGAAVGLVAGVVAGLAVFALVTWRMRIEDLRRVFATVRR